MYLLPHETFSFEVPLPRKVHNLECDIKKPTLKTITNKYLSSYKSKKTRQLNL